MSSHSDQDPRVFSNWHVCGISLLLFGVIFSSTTLAVADTPTNPAEIVTQAAVSHLETKVAEQIFEAAKVTHGLLQRTEPGDVVWQDAWIQLGSLLHANELFEPALKCYAQPLSKSPGHMLANYLTGQALLADEERPDALNLAQVHFQLAIDADPENPSFQISMGIALERGGEMANAHQHFLRANELRPNDAYIITKLGAYAMTKADVQSAIQLYQQALNLQPEASQLHYPLAQAYRRLGMMAKAKQHAKMAGNKQPVLEDPYMLAVRRMASGSSRHLLAGIKLANAGKLSAAQKAFEMALQEEPGNTKAIANLGTTLAARGEHVAALKQFNLALRADPNNYLVRYNVASLLAMGGSDMKARPHFERAVELKPNYVAARLGLGHLFMRVGEFGAARGQYQKIVEQDSRHAVAWYWLGMAQLAAKDNHMASHSLGQAVTLAPRQASITHAWARSIAVDRQSTVTEMKKARSLTNLLFKQRPFFVYGETLAMLHIALGEVTEGLTLLTRLIDEARGKGTLALADQMQTRKEKAIRSDNDVVAWPSTDEIFKARPIGSPGQ